MLDSGHRGRATARIPSRIVRRAEAGEVEDGQLGLHSASIAAVNDAVDSNARWTGQIGEHERRVRTVGGRHQAGSRVRHDTIGTAEISRARLSHARRTCCHERDVIFAELAFGLTTNALDGGVVRESVRINASWYVFVRSDAWSGAAEAVLQETDRYQNVAFL